MALTKGFIRNAATAPLDTRLADMGQHVCNNDGSPRVGVLGNPGGTSIVSTTGTWNVSIAGAEFLTSKGKADGAAAFTNNGATNVLIGGAPGSNSRIDVIWVKHEDNTTGDSASLPIFGVTAGAAAASPTKPAIPTGALELATLRVYAGTTATNNGANTLVNTYQMTAARGGVVPVRTIAERDAWTNPCDGQLVYVIAADAMFQYLASAPTPGYWNHVAGGPIASTLVFSGTWKTSALVPLGAYCQGGRGYLEGNFTTTAATAGAQINYTVGTLPVEMRPAKRAVFIVGWGDTGLAQLAVNTDGTVVVNFFGAPGTVADNVLQVRVDGCNWRLASVGIN